MESTELLAVAQDAWIDHAGGSPPDWRLFNATLSQLQTVFPGENELRTFIRDSIAAWIWSHGSEDRIPTINLNTSLLSESNTRRLEAYRAKAGNSLSRAIQLSDEVLLAEQEWLQWINAGELPDFECFKPCAAWLVASMLWKRPLDQISKLKGTKDVAGQLLGKSFQELTSKTRTKEGCEVFLRVVQPPLDEALETHLCKLGWLSVNTTEEGVVKRFMKEGAKSLFKTHNLQKRDQMLADLLGVPLHQSWETEEADESEDPEDPPEQQKRKPFKPLVSQALLQQAKEVEDE